MTPKDNFLNAQPSIVTNDEPARADDLSTTDPELETAKEKVKKNPAKEEPFVNTVNDAGEKEIFDPGMDEEA